MNKHTIYYFSLLTLAFLTSAVCVNNGFAQDDNSLTPLESVVVDEATTTAIDNDAVVLENIRVYLNNIKNLSAEFSQQGADGRVARGTLHLERPGKIRFEYDGDIPLLIVSDGNILNLIDYDIGQITKWPVSDTPLALLLAEDVQFNAQTSLTNRVNEQGIEFIAITSSNPKNPTQGSLTLIFTKPNISEYELRAWQIIDAQGKLTTVNIGNLSTNEGLDGNLWTFVDPRGEGISRNRRR